MSDRIGDDLDPHSVGDHYDEADRIVAGGTAEMVACTPIQAAFFVRMTPLLQPMATRLSVDVDFLLALCAYEDAWGHDAHNDALHNLFGVTQAGGRNLAFATDQACCDFWEAHYGAVVRGAVTFADFEHRIRRIGYNSRNPSYDSDLMAVYRSVVFHEAACAR